MASAKNSTSVPKIFREIPSGYPRWAKRNLIFGFLFRWGLISFLFFSTSIGWPQAGPGTFHIDFSEPGYQAGKTVVMQGATLTRWIGQNGKCFQVEKDPADNKKNALVLRWPGTRVGNYTALFQPSDFDLGVSYRRDQPHLTEFVLRSSQSFPNYVRASNEAVNHIIIYVGGMAVRLVIYGQNIQAEVIWPGVLNISMGPVPFLPERPVRVHVICLERERYEVEIREIGTKKTWRAVSRRVGKVIQTEGFGFNPDWPRHQEHPYEGEKWVRAHWMNPDWDCIPELRIDCANPNPFPVEGELYLSEVLFQAGLPLR